MKTAEQILTDIDQAIANLEVAYVQKRGVLEAKRNRIQTMMDSGLLEQLTTDKRTVIASVVDPDWTGS